MRILHLIVSLAIFGGVRSAEACPIKNLTTFAETIGYDDSASRRILMECRDLLVSKGPEFAALLISNLREVKLKKLTQADDVQPSVDRVLYSLYALSYITGGLLCTAKASSEFWKLPRLNQEVLLLDHDRVPFFAERITTGAIYFAPLGEQKEIIKQWKAWYKAHGRDHEYKVDVTAACGWAAEVECAPIDCRKLR